MLFVAFALSLLTPAARQATGPADSVIAFVDVTVVPMDRDRLLPAHTVVVRGDRIVAVGPAREVKVPAGARRISGRGKYLMPGLAEMHAHIPGGQAADSTVERVLFLYVANGVTRVRGMLGHPRHLALRERAARGELVAPTIRTSGPSLNGNSIPSADSAARAVRFQRAAGYDFLKIHPGLSREAFDSLAATARALGIGFAGHVPSAVGLRRAIEARYATVDHLDGYVEAMVPPGAPVDPTESAFFGLNLVAHLDTTRIAELVSATRTAGVWNVPTQVLIENLAGPVTADELAARPEMRFVPAETVAQWRQIKLGFLAETGATAEQGRRLIELRRRLIRALHDGGAGLLLGADAPQIWNVPGFAAHRELEALVAAGLTPYQALATGTVAVDRFWGGEEKAGMVVAGYRADLVLLDANPLADVRNAARRSGVMVRGRWLDREELGRGLK